MNFVYIAQKKNQFIAHQQSKCVLIYIPPTGDQLINKSMVYQAVALTFLLIVYHAS